MHRFLQSVAFIEDHLCERFTLAEVAAVAGYSPFHFCRLFQALTGDSVMGYARKRRLTRAAEALTGGSAVRLIDLALDCGFESQAAFTRAFKRQFGMPPGAVRRAGRTWLPRCRWPIDAAAIAHLTETIAMEPTYITHDDIRFIGLRETIGPDQEADGPGVWQRFQPWIPKLVQRKADHTLGVIEVLDKEAGTFAYSAAVEVDSLDDIPEGLTGKTLPGGRFAVFTHTLASPDIGGEIKRTFQYIYGTWVPRSGAKLRAGYDLEYYGDHFDPETISGEVEIWVPVE